MKILMYVSKDYYAWDDEDETVYTLHKSEPRYGEYIAVLIEPVELNKDLSELFG